MYPESYYSFIDYFTMLHKKLLNSKKSRFPRFDKILVIQPIAEMYGEGNERQLCFEIAHKGVELCQIILKSVYKYRSYGPDKSGGTDVRTHIQRSAVVKTKSRSSKQARQKAF